MTIRTPYSLVVSALDLLQTDRGDYFDETREVRSLLRRSGADVVNAGTVIKYEDVRTDTFRWRVVFDSRAWTGR